MNLDAVVTCGRLAWLPSEDAESQAQWHFWNHPHVGTFTSKGGTVLYAIVDGVEERMSVWAYACLEPDKARALDGVTFDSREDMNAILHEVFASHRLVLALADDSFITHWSVADRIGPLYEVVAEFLEHVLAEKLRHQGPRAKIHEQLAWISASAPEPVEARTR
jgi:hypothetical protein